MVLIFNAIYKLFNLNSLICPSCLMFGPNQGNKVCRIEEAAKKLRARMSEAKDSSILIYIQRKAWSNKFNNFIEKDILQYERTENILLDIRHTKIECEEKKALIMKEVELTFSNVIKTLK